MLVDAIFTPKYAEKHPWLMIIVGALYATIAMAIAYKIQPGHSSVVMVFLCVLASMPLVYNTLKYEEKKDEKYNSEKRLLSEHLKALEVFVFLFCGMCIAFSLANAFLPEHATQQLFSAQTDTISGINGAAYQTGGFMKIFTNNLVVLLFCVFFSLLYGLGAIYILTWNASVIGTAIGNLIRTNLAVIAEKVGMEKLAGYFHVYSCAYFLRYLPHGILEIAAYFIAGLGMGIMSVAIVKHAFTSKKFSNIFFDSADLLFISLLVLFIAAIVEVFVTPHLFSALCMG